MYATLGGMTNGMTRALEKLKLRTNLNFIVILGGKCAIAKFPSTRTPKSGQNFVFKGKTISILEIGIGDETKSLFIGHAGPHDETIAGMYLLLQAPGEQF